jgi:uracil-DNA glycosylase
MKLVEYIKKSPLYDERKKIVLYRGAKNPVILFVGEAPGKEENIQGRPFVGRCGHLLDRWIQAHGLQEICGITNAVPLIPLNPLHAIRKPSSQEIEYFRPFLNHMIKKYSPKVLVLLGDSATNAVLSMKISEAKHRRMEKDGYVVTAIYHPSYYLRNGRDGLDDFCALYENVLKSVI